MIIKMELLIIMLFTEKNATTFFYIFFIIIYLNVAKINTFSWLTFSKISLFKSS